jgi:hypothetical protein
MKTNHRPAAVVFAEDKKISVAASQVGVFAVRDVNGAIHEVVGGLLELVHLRELLRIELTDGLITFARSNEIGSSQAVAIKRVRRGVIDI